MAQAASVLQQQAARPKRAGGQDEQRRLHRAADPVLEIAKADAPGSARPGRWVHAKDLPQRVDLGPVGLGARQVGDVYGVLGQYRTARVAASQVLAALLKDAAERMAAVLSEV